MTVSELLKLCEQQVKKGNGDKTILISDDEGNGFHELYYEFTEDVEEADLWGTIRDPKDKIILG